MCINVCFNKEFLPNFDLTVLQAMSSGIPASDNEQKINDLLINFTSLCDHNY